MAAPKPYYATLEEAEKYLISEGFEKNVFIWKCDMTGQCVGDVHVYAVIEGAAPAGYRIREVTK